MTRHIFDTEDNGQGKVWLIGFLSAGTYTGFDGLTCREQAATYIYDHPQGVFWAHNLEYDLTNIFGLEDKYITKHYLGSRLIFADWGSRKFYDTCNLQNPMMSLASMGEECGVPKLQAPSFRSYTPEMRRYNLRDCEVTEAWLKLMEHRCQQANCTLKATLPSTALAMFRQFYDGKLPTNNHYREFLRKAYAGGRTEIFRMGQVRGDIHYADINSMYPSVMKGNIYPDPDAEYVLEELDLGAEGIVDVSIAIPDTYIPSLWCRHNGRTVFPVGTVRGCWTMPEVRNLLSDGGQVTKFHYGVAYSRNVRPFDSYINYCHGLKQKPETKPVGKFLMNSLYGKFGEEGIGLEIGPNGRKITTRHSPHANVIWAAYVTAYARLKLADLMRLTELAGREVLYCDTDSIIYRGGKLWDGNGLGEMEHKASYKVFEALQPKVYRLDNTYRAKGVPQKQAEHYIKYGWASWTRPTRVREATIRGMVPNQWGPTMKERHAVYDKRVVHKGGRTAAHKLDNFHSEDR